MAIVYDFYAAAAMQSMSGVKCVPLIGRNAAVSTSTETVWGPGATYTQLTSAVAFEVVSNSANDTSAGTGARTVQVDLIDGSYVASTVTVTMNGTTAVAITGTFLACNGARVLTSGSGGVNAGTIDVRTVSGSVIKREIQTSTGCRGIDGDFLYTIPAGKVGLLTDVDWSAQTVTGTILATIEKSDSAGNFQTIASNSMGFSSTSLNYGQGKISLQGGYLVPEKTLIQGRALVSVGAGDVIMQGNLFVIDRVLSGL